jgi:peptidyl-dipeptidase A
MSDSLLQKLTHSVGILALALATGCAATTTDSAVVTTPVSEPAAVEAPATPAAPTADEARAFVEKAEKDLYELGVVAAKATWIQQNFITEDTQAVSAKINEEFTNEAVRLAKEAARFDNTSVSPEMRRKLDLLKLYLTAPSPADPEKSKEMATISAQLDAMYGSGKYCPKPDQCMDIEKISEIMAESRDPKKLLEAWNGWHTISPAMRPVYQRFVELSNEGARELGYKDTGAMWRAKYDMPADDFAVELDRLWGQVKPLYNSLHCYVRSRLNAKYGDDVVPENGPIPAHLLGNIWAQEWGNIYDVVAPGKADTGYDLTALLKKKKVDAKGMVGYGERFFTSLGFDPLPPTFWERSLIVKPKDRDVVCHASAWDVDVTDYRIKMCIDVNAEDFGVIHHELGHNFYQRAYNRTQPYIFRNSANDGFHEAVGDTIALSITPEYLVKVGLLDKAPDAKGDINLLLRDALDKVAFLPFGLLVDQWRWKVFSGQISPADYNKGWWELREKYQGVAAPNARTEAMFDPGAKYHIPGNTPYTRYFLARILQFQFHRSLCQAAGYEGPLNRCTIYGNKEAGEKLQAMLEVGQSKPWQEALFAMTGQRQMDATAITDYFAPLKVWLDKQNAGKSCGW